MAYTTVTKVRQSSGFVGNTNVSDAFISGQITRAEGLINSKVKKTYAMPLPKYYQQTIVFTGTGSGAGTLTVTINGENYAVTIANGLTAAQAADRFRQAAEGNDDFVTDGLGAGATVNLYTAEGDDSLLVTIESTDPQTVAGITATGGTVTQVTVPYIEMLATEIAAAMLLITEYGPEAQDTDKDGFKRLSIWEKDLDKIAAKQQEVLDFAGNELPRSTTKSLSFFPTTASQDDETDPTYNRFTMNKRF